MAINRYNLPAEQPIANTYVPIPYQEMLLAAEAQQKAYDDLEAQRKALADTDFYALDPDLDYVTGKQNELQSDVETVYDAYSSGDLRKAKRMYQDISRKWEKELNPLTGITGGAMAQYDKRAEFYKQILENEDLNPTQRQKAMEYFDANYAKQGGIGLDPRNMGSYSTEELAKWINPVEWSDKYGKGFLSDLDAWVDVSPSGGYVIKKNGSHEYVKDEEIYNTLMRYAQADPELMAWLEQGERMGYSSKDMIIQAITGSSEKYGFDKYTKDESWNKDWLYERALDEQKEIDLNTPVVSTSNEQVQDNPLTTALSDAASWLTGGEGSVAGDAFSVVVDDYNEELAPINSRLQEISDILYGTTLDANGNRVPAHTITNEARVSLEKEKAALQGQRTKLEEDRDWYIQMENDALDAVFSEVLPDKQSYEGMSNKEIYEDIKSNGQELSTAINTYDNLITAEADKVISNLRSQDAGSPGQKLKFNVNGQGLIEVTWQGQKYENVPQEVIDYNNKVNEVTSTISSRASYLGDALDIGIPASGLTLEDAQKVLGKITNETNTGILDQVGNKAKEYANNVTTTNTLVTYTPDQIENIPVLNTLQETMNNGSFTFGEYRKIDPSTNKPGEVEEFKNLKGYDFRISDVELSKDGIRLKVAKTLETPKSKIGEINIPAGKYVEMGYVTLDPGSNAQELYASHYKQQLKTLNNSPRTESTQRNIDITEKIVFATDPVFSSTYRIVNDFQEKTPSKYKTAEGSGLSLYKIPDTPYYLPNGQVAYGDMYLSVDEEYGTGDKYNLYGVGYTEEEIVSGKAPFQPLTGDELETNVAGTLLQYYR